MNSLLAGWKDILRPIRDGFRDGFDRPKRSPSPRPEERSKQRNLDALRGFVYFDTFSELKHWTADSVDPLHVSNTPLVLSDPLNVDDRPSSRVLLCHDASGNYLEYEAVGGANLNEEMYTCSYLQYVDVFVYFSHKLVCVPPPTWTNHLHRNGVKVLGTLLIERNIPGYQSIVESWECPNTQNEEARYYPLAHQLAEMAKIYKFDGWLINLEHKFEHWDLRGLLGFLEQLKSDLGDDCELVWYDALTTTNEVSYQNSLTAHNLSLAKAAGSLLSNYRWTEKGAMASVKLAQENQLPLSNIFFGIDVWAQNTHNTGPRRVTYPSKGGGGTNTGLGVAKLAELGLSVGIFAPAWSFEHFPFHGRDVEKAMWVGTELPQGIYCDCAEMAHQTPEYRAYPIAKYAQRRPAGSSTYFYSDFERGFVRRSDGRTDASPLPSVHNGTRSARRTEFDGSDPAKGVEGQGGTEELNRVPIWRSQLAYQSILPQPQQSTNQYPLDAELLSNPSRLRIKCPSVFRPLLHRGPAPVVVSSPFISLFNVSFRGPPKLRIDYTPLLIPPEDKTLHRDHVIYAWLRLEDPDTNTTRTLSLSLPQSPPNERQSFINGFIPEISARTAITEVGLSVTIFGNTATPRGYDPILDIHSIALVPSTTPELTCEVTKIHIIEHTINGKSQLRLSWSFMEPSDRPVDGLPRSNTTGPFAYFDVSVDNLPVQRAYGLQHILHEVSVRKLATGERVEVQVTGVGFDGQICESRVVAVTEG